MMRLKLWSAFIAQILLLPVLALPDNSRFNILCLNLCKCTNFIDFPFFFPVICRFGLFGLKDEIPNNQVLNYVGVSLAVAR